MRISLEKFIAKYTGIVVGVPWDAPNLRGECVSLIQTYLKECLGQPTIARGHAERWLTSYISEGLGTVVKQPKKGDILVWGKEVADGYGHLAIFVEDGKMFDQYNFKPSNGKAGIRKTFGTYKILRPNVELVEDKLYVNLPEFDLQGKSNKEWRVYDLKSKPIVGNEKAFIKPSKFGGLSYEILNFVSKDLVTIQTRDYGKVNIYVNPKTSATITKEPQF